MNPLLRLMALFFLCEAALAQPSHASSVPPIVAGKGWGTVLLGADRKTVESTFGAGKNEKRYDDVYFIDYPTKGFQISYGNKDDIVTAVFFYNRQRGQKHFETFQGRTDRGVGWAASPDDVLKVYGKPTADYSGEAWRRLAFAGIDFRWENGVMVRIGVPGQ